MKSFLWLLQVGQSGQESMSVGARAGRGCHGEGQRLSGAEWLMWGMGKALPISPHLDAVNLVPFGGSQLSASPEKVPRREEELR